MAMNTSLIRIFQKDTGLGVIVKKLRKNPNKDISNYAKGKRETKTIAKDLMC